MENCGNRDFCNFYFNKVEIGFILPLLTHSDEFMLKYFWPMDERILKKLDQNLRQIQENDPFRRNKSTLISERDALINRSRRISY